MTRIYQFFFNNISPEGILFDIFKVTVADNEVVVNSGLIMLMLLALLWVAASYLLGSLNFSIIISKHVYHDDVRRHGSANAGTSNMQRTYGNKAGAITLICDIAKGIVAVLVARVLFGENIAYLSGSACIVGHCFPCFFSFKGGKGVATSIAVILTLNPIVALALILVFGIIVLGTKYISLGSVVCAFLFLIFLDRYYAILNSTGVIEFGSPTLLMTLCSIFIACLVFFRHWGNIKKLLNGTENKLSFKKKNKRYASGDDDDENKKAPPRSLHNIDDEDE